MSAHLYTASDKSFLTKELKLIWKRVVSFTYVNDLLRAPSSILHMLILD